MKSAVSDPVLTSVVYNQMIFPLTFDADLPITIVRGRPQDAKAMFDLELTSFDAEVAFHFRQMQKLLQNPRADIWLLREGSTLVAQLIVLKKRYSDGIHARIYSLTVEPGFRGRGLSKKLLKHGLDQLTKECIYKVYLEVEETAVIPIALYSSLGFKSAERLIDYYAAGRSGIKMRRHLPAVVDAVN